MRQQGSEYRSQSGLGKGHGELEAEVEGVEGGADGRVLFMHSSLL